MWICAGGAALYAWGTQMTSSLVKPASGLGAYWRLGLEEPFRLFFPLALVVSMAGVSLWPLLYAKLLAFHPGICHARLMIQGFAGGFALGFLGTAFPRLVSAPPLTKGEIIWLLSVYTAMSVCHLCNVVIAGDGLFLVLWVSFATALGARFFFLRKDMPPPGFVLAGMGIAGGLTATVMLLVEPLILPAPAWGAFAKLLLYQGFMLLPLMGIGVFFFPRFLGAENRHDFPESEAPPAGWAPKATVAALAGCVVVWTFWLEATGSGVWAGAIRAVVAIGYVAGDVPVLRRARVKGILKLLLRFGILCAAAGIVLSGVLPVQRIALAHILYMGGFAAVILMVATRVILGHSGNPGLAEERRKSVITLVAILLVGVATRVTADFILKIQVSHYIYAALCWVAIAIIWGIRFAKLVSVPDPDDA